MSTAAEILGVLSRADKRWATRHNDIEQDVEYLENLTSAMVTHIAGKNRWSTSLLANLVAAVMADDFDPDGDLVDQAEEAVRIVNQVHTYLLAINARMRGAVA
jgi:hypothetical protein